MEEKENKKLDTKKIIKVLMPLILKFIIVALFLWIGLTFVFGIFRNEGNSMYPALKDGDLCITYKLEDYYTGDVIFFDANGNIKNGRIVAKPGDTIDADDSGILINGSHISEEVFYETDMSISKQNLPITLEDGQFYVLNDYRLDFNDSRTFGIVEKNNMKGKLIFIFRRRGF